MKQTRRHHGFTLIEILVALAIVVVSLAALQRSFAQVIDSTYTLRDRNIALWVAQNKLAQYQMEEHWPSVGTRSDTTVMANREWSWQEKVTKTQIPDVRRVEIEVRARGTDYTLARLVGLVLKPQKKTAL